MTMTTVATIPYPMVDGVRASFVSIEAKFAGQVIPGITKIDYERTRSRTKLYGTNRDPIAKTAGTNEYKATAEMYLAEFVQFISNVLGGAGYGDKFFSVDVTYSVTGMDLVHDQIIGCTLDSTKASNAQGTEGSKREVDLDPVKILFAGLDDNELPLQGSPQ
jgi:hypothetical protein